jgi:hypothetical protein
MISYMVILVAIGVFLASLGIRIFRESVILRIPAGIMCGIVFICALWMIIAFPGSERYSVSWSFYVTAGGAILGFLGVAFIESPRKKEADRVVAIIPSPLQGTPSTSSTGPHTGSLTIHTRYAEKQIGTVDQMVHMFRFVADKGIITQEGICVQPGSKDEKKLTWNQIKRIVIRKLPPFPPYDGKILFDIIPEPDAGGKTIPMRIMPTTRLDYSAMPLGPGQTSMDSFRNLAQFIVFQNPTVEIDPSLKSFILGISPPDKFHNIKEFQQYDEHFG